MTRKRKPVEVIDFETDPFETGKVPEAFAGGHYDGEEYTEFWDEEDCEGECVEKLADYLMDRCSVCYAHNGGKFDFHYLLPWAEEVDVFGARIARMVIGECELRDSFLILPVSLASMDKSEIDYERFKWYNRNKPANRRRISNYLRDDCVYLHRWVSEFEARYGRKQTLAIAAMSELRKSGYKPERVGEDTDTKNRPVYSGGRVTVFQGGKIEGGEKPIRYVDINSAYPYAMTFPHPFGGTIDDDSIPGPKSRHAGKPYFALVDCKTAGAIPSRDKSGKLHYPHGEVNGVWVSSWELEAGEETATLQVEKVHAVKIPQESKSMADFVYPYYEQKKAAKAAGNHADELFAKLMLNSCYGKFAQNPRNFKEWGIFHTRMHPGHEWTLEETFAASDWAIWSRPKEYDEDNPMKFYNVLTAASITGFVRAHLWRAICASVDPIYCDTDSLMCREFHGEIGDGLGQWSIEAELSRVWVGGRKIYAAETVDGDYKTACKGARLEADQIIDMVETGRGIEWKNDAPAFRIGSDAKFINRVIKPGEVY